METKEEFILASIREFMTPLVAPENLDAAMEGIKIARYHEGFTDSMMRGVERHEAHVNAKNRDKQPSIEYLMTREPDGDGMDLHRRTTAWLHEFSRGTVLADGYYPDTKQAALTVCLFRHRPLGEQLQILEFVPLIKPIGGHKILGVREPSLSRYGIFTIRIDPESGSATLTKTTYGHESAVHSAPDLVKCLEYIKVHHGNRDYNDPSDNSAEYGDENEDEDA